VGVRFGPNEVARFSSADMKKGAPAAVRESSVTCVKGAKL
jgi:hypothetical protein